MKVLFVCTGNVYRSRYAEAYFNYLSDKHHMNHIAESAGFSPQIAYDFIRKLPHRLWSETFHRMQEKNIDLSYTADHQQNIRDLTLQNFDTVICLSRIEHRPMWEEVLIEADVKGDEDKKKTKPVFWDVQDYGYMDTDEALDRIEQHVEELIFKEESLEE